MKRSRHIVTFVHHAFADRGTESAFVDDAQDLFRVAHRFHRQSARRAALN